MTFFRVLLVATICCFGSAAAEITVHTGPTYIPRGDAQGERDITVNNGVFAIAFAVDTAPPWGVARGGIVDIALVEGDSVGFDIASLSDFLPNTWTNWQSTYQRVAVTEQSAHEVLIEVERDWGAVELRTSYRIRSDDSLIHMVTVMRNAGDDELGTIKSGYVVWPDGGAMFGIPGLYGVNASSEDAALADWTAAYGENWVLALHAPYATIVEYDGQDRYLEHELEPGASRTFEGWLQISGQGSLAPVVSAEIALTGEPHGELFGEVFTRDKQVVERPAVIAFRNSQPYAFTIGSGGSYSLALPAGDYEVFATAKGHSQGERLAVVVTDGSKSKIDFADVDAPAVVHFQVADAESGEPLDARITIEQGPMPLISHYGTRTLFTELHTVGEVTSGFAPGDYVFSVSSAGGFESVSQLVERELKPGSSNEFDIRIESLASPKDEGWYGADLHHHSDVLDGNTEAEYVMRSELAAGLDIAFLSDHDSVVNNAAMQALAESRSVLFMAGTEMSPSWAHFNAYPLDVDETIEIDPGRSTVQEIFAEARRMGAELIEANHPYMGYGYFNSRDKEMIPGGYDPNFELVEIEAAFHNGGTERNQRTLATVWRMWDNNERKYLAAGSDAHDVWLEPSGAARTYVHIADELTIDAYVEGLRLGRSYASQGPLVFPEIMFGTEIDQPKGELLKLEYQVQAVVGLASTSLVSHGVVIAEKTFDGEQGRVPLTFEVRPESSTWYSLIVEDQDGKAAYTNPVWVNIN